MQADLPHTLYKPRKKWKNSDKEDYKVNPNDPAFSMQQAAYERAIARRKAKAEGKIPFKTEELFR